MFGSFALNEIKADFQCRHDRAKNLLVNLDERRLNRVRAIPANSTRNSRRWMSALPA